MEATATALEALYRSEYLRMRNTLASVTGDYDSARDVVHEAFARALRARTAFRGEASLKTWVWRIALRAATERSGPAGRDEAALDALDIEVLEADRHPELAAALRALSPRRRLIVFLRYFADLSYGEIARVCQISEGTVAATLSQAHGELRASLRRGGAPTEVLDLREGGVAG